MNIPILTTGKGNHRSYERGNNDGITISQRSFTKRRGIGSLASSSNICDVACVCCGLPSPIEVECCGVCLSCGICELTGWCVTTSVNAPLFASR